MPALEAAFEGAYTSQALEIARLRIQSGPSLVTSAMQGLNALACGPWANDDAVIGRVALAFMFFLMAGNWDIPNAEELPRVH
jgi:hypothetical protein